MIFRKRSLIPVVFFVVILAATSAYAGLIFVGGASIGSGSLVATAQIAGFGNNTDTTSVSLNVYGTNLTAMCQNKGGNLAPGQNPINVNLDITQTVSPDKNGTASTSFHVSLLPTWGNAGCPNGKWTVVGLLGYLRVTLTAFDTATGDSDTLVYDCYVNEPFKQVDCTQQPSTF